MSAENIPGDRGLQLQNILDDGRTTVVARCHSNDNDWSDYWTSHGDDLESSGSGVAEGQVFGLERSTEGETEITFRFNEPVQAEGGQAFVVGEFSLLDSASVDIFAGATPVVVNGSNEGNCNLVDVGGGNHIIVLAAGNGTHDVDLDEKHGTSDVHTATLVPSSDSVGYFNYDIDTNEISPVDNPGSPDGGYNLFDFEIHLQRFLNHGHMWPGVANDFLGNEAKMILPHWSWKATMHHGAGTRALIYSFRLALFRVTSK